MEQFYRRLRRLPVAKLLILLILILSMFSSISAVPSSRSSKIFTGTGEPDRKYPELSDDESLAYDNLEDHFDPSVHSEELAMYLEQDEKDAQKATTLSPIRPPNFKGPISYEHFSVMLSHITSSYDFLRIQFGHWLSDEDISNHLEMLLREPWDHGKTQTLDDNLAKVHVYSPTEWQDLDAFNRALDEPYMQLHLLQTYASCGDPSRKVHPVRHFYPTPNRIYVPFDVVLHRCDIHSGCCEDENMTCTAVETNLIRQPFYVVEVMPSSSDDHDRQQVRINPLHMFTKLYFVNHTRCECRPVKLSPTRTAPFLKMVPDYHTKNREKKLASDCRSCPEPFALRYNNATCSCDCFEAHTECLHVKRGKKPLDGLEIKCIKNRQCHSPTCSNGTFDINTGLCPKNKARRKYKWYSHSLPP